MDQFVNQEQKLGGLAKIPSTGGMITVRERALLEYGQKSLVQNMRCWHPGWETRKGYTKNNLTTYNAAGDSPLNIYQFVKGKVDEKHLFVQFGDTKLLEATNDPPDTGTTFGTEVHDGAANQLVAAFANINDYMVYSNGADQHQIYAGLTQRVEAFVVVKDTGAHDLFPGIGEDYTDQLTDGDSATVAILDSLGDLAVDHDAVYFMTKTPIDLVNWTVTAANGTASVMQFHYWNGAWTADTITDNTSVDSKTLAQSGTMVLDTAAPDRTDEIPRYMFNQSGFWYRLSLASGDLDAEVEVSDFTYDCESFTPLANVWNGFPTDLVEAQLYLDATGVYDTFATAAITMDAMTSSDILNVSSNEQLEAIYFGFGATPNETAAVTITIKYWDGSAWQNVTENDGTGGFTESGWIAFGRQSGEFKQQFRDTKYYAYWYQITVSTTLSDTVLMSVLGMPYFNISKLGPVGRVSATWKTRALYTFNKFPRDIYVSQASDHMMLNGSDFAILQPGDGRDNATVAVVAFHNEIMTFQEENGANGGCITIFEGYSPATFGKLVLSTQIGTFNSKTVAVVDGSKVSTTKRDMNSQTMAFFLSHYGVFMSDGRIVTGISDDIQNYFDPRFSECIRKGYESEMWLEHDSTENVIKIGIVSGSSATTCNKFFIYDLVDGQWYEDVYANSLSVFREIEADSGQFHTLQVAAGSVSGHIYNMNTGTNDAGLKIDARLRWEFNQGPYFIAIDEILSRVKVQGAAKTYAWTVEENDVEIDSGTGSMAAYAANETMRRNRHLTDADQEAWMTFSIQANTLDLPLYLYDLGIIASSVENK